MLLPYCPRSLVHICIVRLNIKIDQTSWDKFEQKLIQKSVTLLCLNMLIFFQISLLRIRGWSQIGSVSLTEEYCLSKKSWPNLYSMLRILQFMLYTLMLCRKFADFALHGIHIDDMQEIGGFCTAWYTYWCYAGNWRILHCMVYVLMLFRKFAYFAMHGIHIDAMQEIFLL